MTSYNPQKYLETYTHILPQILYILSGDCIPFQKKKKKRKKKTVIVLIFISISTDPRKVLI